MTTTHATQSATHSTSRRPSRVLTTGVVAIPTAVVATTLAAGLARAVGVDFTIPDGGEQVPLAGIAFVTGVFSTVGVVLAAALARWSRRPATWFVRTTVTLTTVSLAPPVLVGAHPATAATLIGLHLVAAAVMIPALARALRGPTA